MMTVPDSNCGTSNWKFRVKLCRKLIVEVRQFDANCVWQIQNRSSAALAAHELLVDNSTAECFGISLALTLQPARAGNRKRAQCRRLV